MGRRGEGVGLTVAMGGGRLVLDARLMRSSRRDMSLSEICGNEHEKKYINQTVDLTQKNA